MYGAEIGNHGKTISKAKYEFAVKHWAHKAAKKHHRTATIPADWVWARAHVNKKLAARGLTVAGDDLVGVSDIMGAAFVMGAAARGNPAAKRAVAKTVRAAKAGSPSAKKQVRAMRAAKAAAVQATAPKRSWLAFGKPYFRGRAATA